MIKSASVQGVSRKSEYPPAEVMYGGQVEIRDNLQVFKIQMTKTRPPSHCFEHLNLRISDLFRISTFDIRIYFLPERTRI
jgi:hypothetical protein